MTSLCPARHAWLYVHAVGAQDRLYGWARPIRKTVLRGPPAVSARMLDAERCRRFKERRDRLSAAVLWAAFGAVMP